jgi:hypothetical protein
MWSSDSPRSAQSESCAGSAARLTIDAARIDRWQGSSFVGHDAERSNRRRKQFVTGKTPVVVRAESAIETSSEGVESLAAHGSLSNLGRNSAPTLSAARDVRQTCRARTDSSLGANVRR